MARYYEELRQCLTNDELELILMPTERCNFRCTYCYEDRASGRMHPEVIRGVKAFVRRRAPGLRKLKIGWFGGEPLLASDIIEDILSDTRQVLLDYPRVRFQSTMTTNGYLLDGARFERLLNLDLVEYQITLDGPRHYHDKKRLRADGNGTFDRIWDNLLDIRAHTGRFEIIVRLHVDRDNCDSLPEFIEELKSHFGDDPRFRVFFRMLTTLGGPNDRVLPVLSPREGYEAVAELNRRAADRDVRRLTAADCATACYAAHANSFVVRADGRINKCTVALEHPNNLVGHIREDGSLGLEGAKMRMWMRGVLGREEQEMRCPMKGYADQVPVSS